jgi:hypothetical protein
MFNIKRILGFLIYSNYHSLVVQVYQPRSAAIVVTMPLDCDSILLHCKHHG